MSRTFILFFVIFGLCLSVSAQQAAPEPRTLIPGQTIESEIAGGESHTYQLTLTAGQFVRLHLDQRAIDAVLTLTAPDGKPLVEMNLTSAGEPELLSAEAALAGSYRVTISVEGVATLRGGYRLEAAVQPAATAEDRKRLTAEALLVEIVKLRKQRGKTAQEVIEKGEQALSAWRELGEPQWIGYSLSMIGLAHRDLRHPEKAIEYNDQALVIARALKNRPLEGKVLFRLGVASYDLGRQEKAIEYFDQVLVIARGVKDRLGVATYDLGRFERSIEYFDQALVIAREVKDPSLEGKVLIGLGAANFNLGRVELGRVEKAIEYFDLALALARDVKDRSLEGMGLNNLGEAYRTLGRFERSIEYAEQELAFAREVKDRQLEARTLTNLCSDTSGVGRKEKALECYEQALVLVREIKDHEFEVEVLYGLGGTNFNLGRHEKAVEYLEQALAITREVKDGVAEGAALVNLAVTYLTMNRYEKAIEYYEQALAKAREVKSRATEGVALANMAIAYYSLSRYEKAIEYYEQALVIRRELKDRRGEGRTLSNLGIAYSELGRYEKAIEYYEQALAIAREVKNRQGEGNALDNLGDAYNHLKQYPKAIEYLEQVLTLSRELKNPRLEASALNALGDAYAHSSRHEKAIEYYERALALHREVKNRRWEAETLTSLGNMQRQLGQTDKAAKSGGQAVAILREIEALDLEVAALYALAQTERDRGNGRQARTLVEESLRVAESMRAGLVSPESRTSFLATVQGSYQLYTDILMSQHKAEPTNGFDALAVEVSERQRARSLLDLLTEAGADLRQGVDAALLERERIVGRQLNDKAQRLTQATKPEQLAALKQEISQLENDYERAQAAIRKDNPHYAAIVQPQPLKFTEIQQQLDADTLLLEYALGEEHSYLWAITRDSLTNYELPKAEQINQSALRVYELLTTRSTSNRGEIASERQARIVKAETALPSAAQSLSDILLAPVAAQLGNKRLVIVADGALQYIPFAMLPEPSVVSGQLSVAKNKGPRTTDNGQPLIVKHEVVSLPSASALAIQRTELAGRQPAPKMLAVIADPVFDRADPRLTVSATQTNDTEQTQTLAYNDARSIEHLAGKSDEKSDVTTLRLVIPRLPYTRQEANRILELSPKSSSFSAVDFQASRTTVLNGDLSQYRYVHFATHGLLDSERPGLSALVFSMVDAAGKPQNGFLRANDIYNLKLPAELVVLSACQTGLGKDIKGEGLVGLTRGFMYAGAARVVVSLWNVNDKATADLMTKFYEKMLKQGEPPAAALRAAQVEMWRQKQWQSPYYWAAFTMQGEWR